MSNINTQHGKFTDLEDDNGNVIKTAQNVYQEWLAQQNAIPSPTMEDRLSALEEAMLENMLS